MINFILNRLKFKEFNYIKDIIEFIFMDFIAIFEFYTGKSITA